MEPSWLIQWFAGPGSEVVRTIASSIAGLGSLAAVVVAVRVYRRQVRDAHRDQAAQIILECADGATLDASLRSKDATGEQAITPLVRLKLANYSTLPIFDVEFFSYGSPPYAIGAELPIQSIKPGSSRGLEVKYVYKYDKLAAALFRDAAGNSWIRYHDGHLCEAKRNIKWQQFYRIANRRLKSKYIDIFEIVGLWAWPTLRSSATPATDRHATTSSPAEN